MLANVVMAACTKRRTAFCSSSKPRRVFSSALISDSSPSPFACAVARSDLRLRISLSNSDALPAFFISFSRAFSDFSFWWLCPFLPCLSPPHFPNRPFLSFSFLASEGVGDGEG